MICPICHESMLDYNNYWKCLECGKILVKNNLDIF